MNLISEFIKNKLRLQAQAELNKSYLVSIWNFYQAYSVALMITGIEDERINDKNRAISILINSLKDKLNISLCNKLFNSMKKDIQVINLAMEIIKEKEDEGNFFGNNYSFGMAGISTMYD